MAIHGEGRTFELIRCDTDEQWRARRREGVGGSDVAAIMGLSPYRAPYEVWAEKVGLTEGPDLSQVEAVRWGSILEQPIIDRYAELHPERRVERVNAMCRSLARPWAQASLDAQVHDPDLGWGVLEIKTAGLRREADWADGVPLHYLTQVTHYLSVTGRPFADVAVLIGGQEYREFRVVRDSDDVAAVTRAVDAFWHGYVEARVPPECEGYGREARALLAAHGSPHDELEAAISDDVPELVAWLRAKEEADASKRALDKAADALKGRIGEAAGIECELGRVKWVRAERTSFDSKRFRSENPEAFEKYSVTKTADGGLRWTPRKEG